MSKMQSAEIFASPTSTVNTTVSVPTTYNSNKKKSGKGESERSEKCNYYTRHVIPSCVPNLDAFGEAIPEIPPQRFHKHLSRAGAPISQYMGPADGSQF